MSKNIEPYKIENGPAPAVLVQWGAPVFEFEDFPEIKMLLEADVYSNSAHFKKEGLDICTCRIFEESSEAFESGLTNVLRRNQELQTLYLAAHGSSGGLVFAVDSKAKISYQRIGEIVEENTTDAALQVVFGCCGAMRAVPHVESHFPTNVYEVVGFSNKPTGLAAAELMAGVLKDQVKLFREIMFPQTPKLGSATESTERQSAIRHIFCSVLDAHEDSSYDLMQNQEDLFLVRAYWDSATREWGRANRVIPHMRFPDM